jgi:hypothetical protein
MLSRDPIGQLAVLVAILEVIAGYRATSCQMPPMSEGVVICLSVLRWGRLSWFKNPNRPDSRI